MMALMEWRRQGLLSIRSASQNIDTVIEEALTLNDFEVRDLALEIRRRQDEYRSERQNRF